MKTIQQFNIVKFYETDPQNSSKLYPKQCFQKTSKKVSHQRELLKD